MHVVSWMKILMIIPTFAPVVGGAERQLEGMVQPLINHGHDVIVLTRRLPGTTAIDYSNGYLVRRLHTLGFKLGFHITLTLFLLIYARRYDIIHCHTLSGPAAICSLSGFLLKRPVLLKVTRSGPGSQIQQWQGSTIRQLVFKLVLQRCSRFVAISADTYTELTAVGVEQDKLVHIPNGVAVPPEAHLTSSMLPMIIYTGRLIPRKRVDLLLRAFAKSQHARNCKLTVVGDGPMRAELETLTINLGIEHQVVFTGEIDKNTLQDTLPLADIFVLPSKSEGMSNSLLEAMSHGLAVMASNINANRELIDHGVSGFLFENEEVLSQQLDQIATDTQLRECLGRKAYEFVLNNNSFKIIANKYHALYRSLAN